MAINSKSPYSAKDDQMLMSKLWSPEIKDNPYNFTMFTFPWGQPNTPLANYKGPRTWQKEVMLEIAEHIKENKERVKRKEVPKMFQMSISSGRGIGKSALTSWINYWFLSTVIGGSAVTTANTEQQLKSRTWAELGKWHTMAINGHWFERTALSLIPSKWYGEAIQKQLKVDTKYYYGQAQLWSEENPDAFAGLHNDNGICLIYDEACHDDKTEVLTDAGWKLFDDLSAKDRLMTMHPLTHKAEYLKPTKIFKSYRKGKMYKSVGRGRDFCVTPNHEMYFKTQKAGWRKRQIQEMPETASYFKRTIDWQAEDRLEYKIPKIKTSQKTYKEKIVPMDDWVEIMAWYLSDGGLIIRNGNYFGFSIFQKNGKALDSVYDNLLRNGFNPKKYKSKEMTTIKVHSAGLSTYLSRYGIGAKDRRVPRYIQNLSTRQIKIFMDIFLLADGYNKKSQKIIYTSNESLAGDLQELYLKLGYRCTVTKRRLAGKMNWIKDHWAKSTRDGYVVAASEPNYIKYTKSKSQIVDYEGYVYCAEVPPNHLLFTRRNGKCLWSGNSGIPEKIWTVSKGFFTEKTLHRYFFAFSNPRRNTGAFYETHHKNRKRWHRKKIDSRTVEGVDHDMLESIIDEYGEDSDEARMEVKGEFPKQGDNQFISRDLIQDAIERDIYKDDYAPLIMGVDIARFGNDQSVIAFRRGRDARSIKAVKLTQKDNMEVANTVGYYIDKYKPNAVCIDAGNGTGVIDRLKEMGYKVNEVWFGSKSSKEEFGNKRTEIWGAMRDWLRGGCIANDDNLIDDLSGPQYKFRGSSDKIILESKEEMKKRGIASPDYGDALACTFAVRVSRLDQKHSRKKNRSFAQNVNYKIFG